MGYRRQVVSQYLFPVGIPLQDHEICVSHGLLHVLPTSPPFSEKTQNISNMSSSAYGGCKVEVAYWKKIGTKIGDNSEDINVFEVLHRCKSISCCIYS